MSVPKASLIVKEDTSREIPLDGSPIMIGAGDICKVAIKGNGCASFTHAEVRFDNGAFQLTDLGSRDGTRVNGTKITRHALRNGDLILIGGVKITYCQPLAEPPAAPAPAPAAKKVGESTDRLPPLQFEPEDDEYNRKERRELLILGSITVVVVLGFLLCLPFFFSDGGKKDARVAVPWVDVRTEAGASAYVTLPHTAARSRDPEIAGVISSQDDRSQIMIQGVKAGTTKVYADGTRGQLWEISVTVMPKEEWPPGWTDNDRLAAAEKLRTEADPLYRDRDAREQNLVPCCYRYAKILRLYRNCRYAPETPCEEARERKDELETAITKLETQHVHEFWRTFRTGDLTMARAHVKDLMTLFPEDGGDQDPLAAHGNNAKHQQYFILGMKIEQIAKDLRNQ